ncbi:HNH endonuclease [Burkholderia sp. AU31624]|uniref:HNH endonuclease signature motif containing protein n=1 Tax=Burkholderia sp. AU31624 TaxID=2879629 RepID=UPI001CF424E3|nr:HNH endonuclease signature motif containing protein [Burkholderia sp. AU31624]MCA8251801.1 HNH endonuclease [Burkholderia sp. AU31624]
MSIEQNIDKWVYMDPICGCWIWTGSCDRDGYGKFRRTQIAHRAIYKWAKGPIPAGMELDHLCRMRCCVNPNHLEPVTTRENMIRGFSVSSINARKTHCDRGHELSGANLYVWRGGRYCRACNVLRARACKARKGAQ